MSQFTEDMERRIIEMLGPEHVASLLPIDVRLKGVPIEELVKSVSIEDRVNSVTLEERAKGLSVEELERVLERARAAKSRQD